MAEVSQLRQKSELIVEEAIGGNPSLQKRMLADVAGMSHRTRDIILPGMLKMHKEIENEV